MMMKKILCYLMTMLSWCPAQAQDSSLAGEWQFIAGTFQGKIDTIPFTATLAADGQALACHADNFFQRGSKPYPMDWKMALKEEGGKTVLGWVLTAEEPASTAEFQEVVSRYIMGGKEADGSHRYIYLLSENIETQQLEGMTLWCSYDGEKTAYLLPKTQQVYGVVSEHIPFNGAVGFMEIWASGRVQKKNDDPAGISEIVGKETSDGSYFDLQGRRISGKPQKGIYITNGRKYILR